MNRKENKELHNLYWNKVFNIFKNCDPSKISLKTLWAFTSLSEIKNNFSLDLNSFDPNNFDSISIANGYRPSYKSSLRQYCEDKIKLVVDEIPNDVDQIIDLGSGWGRYSVILSQLFPEKKIFSLENSDSGVECCKMLKEKYGLDNLHCHNFDYYQPDALRQHVSPHSKNQNVFCFSSYSIEQIPYLRSETFDIILNAGFNSVKFFHIEPIGWQVMGTRKNTINRYNNNLFPLLKEMERQNIIEITKIEVDAYGKKQNPGTIVVWKKKK